MLLRHHVRLSAFLTLLACSPPSTDAPSPVTAGTVTALASPSAWAGDLPCADCAAVETTITLAPDGTYRRQGVYRGTKGGGDTILTDIGRWTHHEAGARITLRGSVQGPDQFAVEPDGALRLLDLEGQPIVAARNYRLVAVPEPVTITHPARVVAAFQYMADAASAVECRSGLPYPVDMSADYPMLEARYLASGTRPGAPLVVRLRAHLAQRPGMEGNDTVTALVVDSVAAVHADDRCAALRTQDAIAAHGWRLIALRGPDGDLPVPADNHATFTWDRADGHFMGTSGCNRYRALGVMRGTTMAASPASGTRRACVAPEANAIERRLLALLAARPALRLDADTLVFSEGPTDIARFVRDEASRPPMD